MKRTLKLDMNKLAKMLGAERGGRVLAHSGYFGALQLAAEVRARFQVPPGGGRARATGRTERRLVPVAPKTLTRLSRLSKRLREEEGIAIEPLQLAGLLLEHAAEDVDDSAA